MLTLDRDRLSESIYDYDISNVMKRCTLCDEIISGQTPNLFSAVFGENLTRVVTETSSLVAIPSFGQITEGYMLVVSKEHVPSWVALNSKGFYEILEGVRLVAGCLSDLYCKPIIFEHGAFSDVRRGGCCVVHAHVHIVPCPVSINPEVEQTLAGVKIQDLEELPYVVDGNPYIVVEDECGTFVYDANSVASQFIRRLIASKMHRYNRWDWRFYVGKSELLRTLEKCKAYFDNERSYAPFSKSVSAL